MVAVDPFFGSEETMGELLDAAELARRLKVTVATIHAWHRRGWIPCLRAGQRPVLFDAEEVAEAMRDRAVRKGVGHAK